MAERVEIDIIARTEKAVAGLSSFIKQIAASYVSYKALKELLASSIKEALEAERTYIALGSALRASGQNTEVYTKQLMGLARALSMTTTFAEEETAGAMQSLTQIGRVSAEGMKQIIPVVQDLASGLGVDLNSAALLVGKAIEGNAGVLGRYGIKIKETSDPTERFSEIIKGLNERFGGMSEAMAKSAGGGLKQIKNEFNELKEAVGTRLLQAFKGTIAGLASMMKSSVILGMDVKDIGSIEEARAYIKVLEDYYDRIEEATAKLGKSLGRDSSQYYLASQTVAEVTARIRELNGLVNALGKTGDRGESSLLPGLTGDTVELIDKMTIALDNQARGWVALGQAVWDADIPAEITNIANRYVALGEAYEEVIPVIEETAEAFKNMNQFLVYTAPYDSDTLSNIEKQAEAIENLNEKFKDLAVTMASDALVGFFKAIGEAAAGGDSLADSMKKLASQLAQQMGQMFVQAGLQVIIYNAYNPAMVALGIALIAAGGVSIIGGAFVEAQDTGGSASVPDSARGNIIAFPSESRAPGGGTVINHNYNIGGSIWQTEDLARAVASRLARW